MHQILKFGGQVAVAVAVVKLFVKILLAARVAVAVVVETLAETAVRVGLEALERLERQQRITVFL